MASSTVHYTSRKGLVGSAKKFEMSSMVASISTLMNSPTRYGRLSATHSPG